MQGIRQEQRRVALGMGFALLLTIVLFATILTGDGAEAAHPFVDRMQTTLRADLFLVIWLAAAIGNVARLRFFSATDIEGSGSGHASEPVRQASAILQNTYEQVCLAVLAHMIMAATFAHPPRLTNALVLLFCVGRLLFWIGYHRGAGGRAFGFALTFYPSVIALLVSAFALMAG